MITGRARPFWLRLSIFLNIILAFLLCININLDLRIDQEDKNVAVVHPGLNGAISSEWKSNQHFAQRGDYWVGYNKVAAQKKFQGNESIALTTPADHTNLDNLITLVEHWQGPISVALFTPGTDYYDALKTVLYLRECSTPLIKELVTFHVFFPREHIPPKVLSTTWERIESEFNDCGRTSLVLNSKGETYRKHENLHFPINVARNIARESASTHFVFPSDIELFPSTNFIPKFLEMVQKNSELVSPGGRQVYVLPVFELRPTVTSIPRTKTELKELYDSGLAIMFHRFICRNCHNIPELDKWMESSARSGEMDAFTIAKRMGKQSPWEPFYVGTKNDPVFDERVTWEGRKNKRIQAYVLCVLDYDFYVLDNAFLVHKPGIKYKSNSHNNETAVAEMNDKIRNVIIPEFTQLYGRRKGCKL